VRHLLKNNTEAVVSVSQKELTVMFSDIKGFTQKVEEMSPQQLSILLSDYLSAMCAIIGENEGTVDKFIGDAIMALWNVPLPVNGHTIKACTTALDSVKCLKKLNPKWKSNGLPEIQCRIGIHTGLALCGNLGSNERLSYTAVGDSVNLASRLEALNKRYDTSILISGEVYEQVKHIFLCRFLDVVVVQGKRHPTHVYELVGEKNKASDRDIEIARIQHEAVVAFFEKRFEESLRHLATLREMLPSDMSVESLSERATAAINNPNSISADWMGYYILTEK
jgi:adenylate cyclase